MKIQITINESTMNGYLCISPLLGGNFRNFDEYCPNHAANELYCPTILDYVHCSEVANIIKYFCSKLKHGGKIIIGGSSLYEIAKGICSGQIDGARANQILFGEIGINPIIKHGMYDWTDIEDLLINFGLKIIHKRISGRSFIIEAIRL